MRPVLQYNQETKRGPSLAVQSLFSPYLASSKHKSFTNTSAKYKHCYVTLSNRRTPARYYPNSTNQLP